MHTTFKKMLKKVKETPFVPIKWMKDHRGMQGKEFFEDPFEIEAQKKQWLEGRDRQMSVAQEMSDQGVTKQIVNRLLEPWMWHTAIVTATEWENFFALRAHPEAEIHIADLAERMLVQYNLSDPKELKPGEWHIPFGENIDEDRLMYLISTTYTGDVPQEIVDQYRVSIATARCARVSYLNFEGKDDYDADVTLYDNLSTVGHWSPFEHCARAMTERQYAMNKINIWPYKNDIPGAEKVYTTKEESQPAWSYIGEVYQETSEGLYSIGKTLMERINKTEGS